MTPTHYAARLALMYGAVFTIYGVQLPYLGVWLDGRGLNAFEIGLVTAIPMFARLLANPAVAMVADVGGRHALVVRTLAAVGFVSGALLFAVEDWRAIALLIALFTVAVQSAMPLIEVVAMRGVRQLGLDYGHMRLWGSITFILATLAGGAAVARLGPESVLWLLIIAAAANAAAAWALPSATGTAADDKTSHDGGNASRPKPGGAGWARQWATLAELVKRGDVVAVIVCASAVQASHGVYYAFSAIHWSRMGLSGDVIGLLWSVGVIAEIALFWVAGPVVRRLGPVGLLGVGGLAALVRWSAMALDPGIAWLFALQTLHAFTFGATHLASVHHIAARVPDEQAGLAQSLSATFSTGVAMAAALYAAGVLYGHYAELSYLAMAALGGIGVVGALGLMWNARRG